MGWRKKQPPPPPKKGNAFSEKELTERLKRGPLNEHHPLPQSRWDRDFMKNPNTTIGLNVRMHTELWHGRLYQNMIAREIAQQTTIWAQEGFIFLGDNRKVKVYCGYTAPGTLDDKWRRPTISLTMTKEQVDAFDELFGLYTQPGVFEKIVNRYFVHRESPIQVIPSWGFMRR